MGRRAREGPSQHPPPLRLLMPEGVAGLNSLVGPLEPAVVFILLTQNSLSACNTLQDFLPGLSIPALICTGRRA